MVLLERACKSELPFRANVFPLGPIVAQTRRRDDASIAAESRFQIERAMAMVEGGRVVVVEDDDGMREAIERLLDAAGFESATYASAESLLAAGNRPGVACVISDLKLPAMSGLDLLDEICLRDGWPPVIVITAHDSPGVRDEAIRRGAAAYLAKPFRGRALLDAIARISDPEPLQRMDQVNFENQGHGS